MMGEQAESSVTRHASKPILHHIVEPFVELALDARTAAGDPNLLVLGYTGGVPGYLPYPPALYQNGGYEICEAHHFYGQPDAFAAEAGLSLRAASDRLLGVAGEPGSTTTTSTATERQR